MDNNILKVTTEPVDELIVIPDECGDTLWDKVLEQPEFTKAVKLVSKEEPDTKAKEVNE